MKPNLTLLLALLLQLSAQAQEDRIPSTMDLMSAQWYDRFEGVARAKQIGQLRGQFWYAYDTIYTLKSGWKDFETKEHLLAPFLDSSGRVVHLVPETAPEYPGGRKALAQFIQDVLGADAVLPGDEVQNSLYAKCTILSDGSAVDIAWVQAPLHLSKPELAERCLDALRYMPTWKPGTDRGKPVATMVLFTFSIK